MKSLKLISSAITMLLCFVTLAQERTITGTVSDANGPLPGVNISVKKSTKITTTNFDGKYSIQATKGDELVFSFIGCMTQTAVVKDKNVINIKMVDNSQTLQEVVVVGYGSTSGYVKNNYVRSDRKKQS